MRRDKNELITGQGKLRDRAPPVRDGDGLEVMRLRVALQKEKSRRLGAKTTSIRTSGNDDGEIRYPEVRGLRFVPETRKFHDRVRMAAISIARLRVLELTCGGRPVCFIRIIDSTQTVAKEIPTLSGKVFHSY
eukprot:355746-Chlamydomonas_euryale.AAC.3